MWNREQAVEFAESSADAAIDQWDEYPDAVGSYADNVVDSMNEQRVDGNDHQFAIAAYWDRLRARADNPPRWMSPSLVAPLRARLAQEAR